MSTIHWFRLDLRLQDNPALKAALERPGGVIPLYIYSPEEEAPWGPGGASAWWLHHALVDLQAELKAKGLHLIIREGSAQSVLEALAEETGAHTVTWSRRYEPHIVARDSQIKTALKDKGIEALSFNSALLFEPHTLKNKAGGPFQVFTPFWKHCQGLLHGGPVEMPQGPWQGVDYNISSLSVDDLLLLPKLPWASGLASTWEVSRKGAQGTLQYFIDHHIHDYSVQRDYPSQGGTSRLSAYLHFGQIGPREVVFAVKQAIPIATPNTDKFLAEIGWREFAYHLLWHFPHTPDAPLRPVFETFPWEPNPVWVEAWQKGQTGYPIIDAGMRELWQTGTLHNRVRMVVASFLVKQLLQPWQAGARWFWDTLVDADLASNTLGWQWSAGCGADAAPYFRVFNPILQGEKFDKEGAYVKRYVPELRHLPAKWLHRPWEAGSETLEDAGIVLGKTYPCPIILPAEGRDRALAAYHYFRSNSSPHADV